MWWVRSRFYNKGKVNVSVLSDEQCASDKKKPFRSLPKYDEYWNSFPNKEDADLFANDTLKA